MKKLFEKSLLALFICGFISCSNEQDEIVSQKQSDKKSVELVNGGAMLKFKDMKAYEDALFRISAMTTQERFNYLDSLPFKPQVVVMQEADDELTSICDQATDRATFDAMYLKFKQKYGQLFMFNESDLSDLSPYSRLVYAVDEHFVNERGQFMIGDSLVKSKVYRDYQERQQQFTVSTRSISDLGSVNDAYSRQSDRKVGMQLSAGIYEGVYLIHVTFTSQKKGVFGWKRYDTRYYTDINIRGGGFEFAQGGFMGGPAYVNKDGILFRLETAEMGGNTSMIFGRRSVSERCKGTIEIWSRGVVYADRGYSSVDI